MHPVWCCMMSVRGSRQFLYAHVHYICTPDFDGRVEPVKVPGPFSSAGCCEDHHKKGGTSGEAVFLRCTNSGACRLPDGEPQGKVAKKEATVFFYFLQQMSPCAQPARHTQGTQGSIRQEAGFVHGQCYGTTVFCHASSSSLSSMAHTAGSQCRGRYWSGWQAYRSSPVCASEQPSSSSTSSSSEPSWLEASMCAARSE